MLIDLCRVGFPKNPNKNSVSKVFWHISPKIHRNARPFPFAIPSINCTSVTCFSQDIVSIVSIVILALVPLKEEVCPRSKSNSLISLLLYSLMRLTLKSQEEVKEGTAKEVIECTHPSLSDQVDKHKRKKSISISFYSDHHPHVTYENHVAWGK